MTRLQAGVLLFVVSFPLWYLGMRLRGGESLLDHSPIDQDTRQAEAWLARRIDLPKAPRYLEIAQYQGRSYDSFPPTPSLVELPLVVLFGKETPDSLALYAFWYAALVAMFTVSTRRGWDTRSALLVALTFVFGTNVYTSCVRANVWGYGQGLGFCLAMVGLAFVTDNRQRLFGPGWGYLLLSLAVGCRPFYLFVAPLFVVLDFRTSRPDLARVVRSAVSWMAPYGIALGLYNYARFGSPLEFGHAYLGWARDLPHGIFSVTYVPWNLYHALLRLPAWSREWPPLEFDPWGTAFWLNNGIFLYCLYGLVRLPLDRAVRTAAAVSLALVWTGLLMHQTNGWRQFGYRYLIDLLPIGFVVLTFTYRRFTRGMWAALVWSFAVNLYGLMAWKEMPRPY